MSTEESGSPETQQEGAPASAVKSKGSEGREYLANVLVSFDEEGSLDNFLDYFFKRKPSSLFNEKKFTEHTKIFGDELHTSAFDVKYKKEDFFKFTFLQKEKVTEDLAEEDEGVEKEVFNLFLYLKLFSDPKSIDLAPIRRITNVKYFDVRNTLILLFVNSADEEQQFDEFDAENLLIVNLKKKKINKRRLMKNFLKFISLKEAEKQEREQAIEEMKIKEEEAEALPKPNEEPSPDETQIPLEELVSGEKVPEKLKKEETSPDTSEIEEELKKLREENEVLKKEKDEYEEDYFEIERKLKKLKKKKGNYKCNSIKFENEFQELVKQKAEDDKIFQKIKSEKVIVENLRKKDEERFKKELETLRSNLKEKDLVVEQLSSQKNDLLTMMEKAKKEGKSKETIKKTEPPRLSPKKKKTGTKSARAAATKKKRPKYGMSRKSKTLRVRPGTSPFSLRKERNRYANRKIIRPGPAKRGSTSSSRMFNKTSPVSALKYKKIDYLKKRKKTNAEHAQKIENEKLQQRMKELYQETAMKEKARILLQLQLKNEKRMRKSSEIQAKKLKELLLKKNDTISYLRLKISKM